MKGIAYLLVFFASISIGRAGVTWDDKFNEAKKLVANEKYEQAIPKLQDLLIEKPESVDAKYLLSKSLQIDPSQIGNSIELLENAMKQAKGAKLIDVQVLLSKLYHKNYQFQQAVQLYTHLDTTLTINKINISSVRNIAQINDDFKVLIKQCHSAKRILKSLTMAEIKKLRQLEEKQLIASYRKALGKELWKARSYQVKPAVMNSVEDDKSSEVMLMHIIDDGLKRIYSEHKMNKFGRRDKDLVIELKEKEGGWFERQYVGDIVNSPWDEDYPFLSEDGNTLYFSSNGSGSMGGYDIFRCQRDTATGYWGKPINLGFPINTPYDELLFVQDEKQLKAYFSSNRYAGIQDLDLFEMTVKNYEHTPYAFLIESKVGGTSETIKNVSVSNYYKPDYQSTGIALNGGSKFLFMVNQLERYLLNIELSSGQRFSTDVFSSTPSKSISSTLSLHREKTGNSLEKEYTRDGKQKSEMIKLMLNNSFKKQSEDENSLSIEALKMSDSLDFQLIARQRALLFSLLSAQERTFYRCYEQVRADSKSLDEWSRFKIAKDLGKYKLHKRAESTLNQLVVELFFLKNSYKQVELLRRELALLTQVSYLKDTLSTTKNIELRKRKLNKLYQMFSVDFEKLRGEHLTLIQKNDLFYKGLIAMKDSVELENFNLGHENLNIMSKVALLEEEMKEAQRQYNNAWWRGKKRRLQKTIDLISMDIKAQKEVANENKGKTDLRNSTLDLAAIYCEVADLRYEPANLDSAYFQLQPVMNYLYIDTVLQHQYSMMIGFSESERVLPRLYTISSELGASLNEFVVSEEKLRFSIKDVVEDFKIPSDAQEQVRTDYVIDSSAFSAIGEGIDEELKQEDELYFTKHTVASKETIYSLARRYNVTVKEIKHWNSKTSIYNEGIDWSDGKRIGRYKNWLYVGEQLRVVKRHRVQSGESLKIIAKAYGMSKKELKEINTKSSKNKAGIDWSSPRRSGKKFEWLYVGETLMVK